MAVHPDDWLSARLAYLEESRSRTLETLDQIIALSASSIDEEEKPSVAKVLARSAGQLGKLIPFSAWAFFLSDLPGGRFRLARCRPAGKRCDLQRIFEGLAQYGAPSWALHHPHPVVTALPGAEDRLLLHSLATPSRIRGLFLGRLGAPLQEVPDISLAVLTITLQVTACQLEGLELRDALRAGQRKLHSAEARIARLEETVRSLRKTARATRKKPAAK